jgi:hypothetical protein
MTAESRMRRAKRRWQRHGAEWVSEGGSQFHIPQPNGHIGLDGPLRVELLEDGLRARLIEPFRVQLREFGGQTIEVPQGFETDFASVPRFFWRIVPPWGRYSPAAVVHDYLYQSGKLARAEADWVFLTLMQRLGVPAWKRNVMYEAVRLFGGSAWNTCREKEEVL